MGLYNYVLRKGSILNHMYCLKLLDQRLYTVLSISWEKKITHYSYDIDINLDNTPKNWVNTIETTEDQNITDCHIQKTKVINFYRWQSYNFYRWQSAIENFWL